MGTRRHRPKGRKKKKTDSTPRYRKQISVFLCVLLLPNGCIVTIQTQRQRASSYKYLGPSWAIAVCIKRIGWFWITCEEVPVHCIMSLQGREREREGRGGGGGGGRAGGRGTFFKTKPIRVMQNLPTNLATFSKSTP